MMHLSRFAEELVLWRSIEWHFVEIGDAFTTGSSIMPQKKNPQMAELIRGKTGRAYDNLVSLLTVMKDIPLAYNCDMQEDKEALFDSADTLADCLKISGLMLGTVKFEKEGSIKINSLLEEEHFVSCLCPFSFRVMLDDSRLSDKDYLLGNVRCQIGDTF